MRVRVRARCFHVHSRRRVYIGAYTHQQPQVYDCLQQRGHVFPVFYDVTVSRRRNAMGFAAAEREYYTLTSWE